MLNKYVFLDKNFEIRRAKSMKHMLLIKDITATNVKFYVNDLAVEIFSLMDGTKTYNDIIEILQDKYSEAFDSVKSKLDMFFKQIDNDYGFKVIFSDSLVNKPVKVIDTNNIYPVVVSIELTHKCNLRCLHCYGEYDCKNNDEADLDCVKKFLKDAKDIGVEIIELTGGDISVYPHLMEVLETCLELKFENIALLTNGVVLSSDIVDFIIENKDRFVVQIDLHSLRDEYLAWFTGAKNTVEKIKALIKKLVDNDVVLRVASTITKKNIDELEEIADWLHDNGVKRFAAGPVIKMGRAENNDVLLDDIESINKFNAAVKNINARYDKFIGIIDEFDLHRENCGTLTSNVCIAPSGEIKYCVMDNMSDLNCNIGNVFRKSIKDIYDEHSNLFIDIANAASPKLNSDECRECVHRYFCANCLLRGLLKHKQIGEKCKWYSKHMTKLMQQKLLS